MSQEENLARAMEAAKATMDGISEMVADLKKAVEADDDAAREKAEQAIHEDPLSLEVREDWKLPGDKGELAEFRLLLSTGGPAVQIVGEIGMFNVPENPRLQCQDWFIPWTDVPLTAEQQDDLLSYCGCFYFGDG